MGARRSLLLVVIVASLASPAARASASLRVDAGSTQATMTGQQFSLVGVLEDPAGDATTTWTAQIGCTVDAPTSLETTAMCAEPGTRWFTLAATGSGGSASDTVAIVVTHDATVQLLQASRDAGPAVPDESLPDGSGSIDEQTVRIPFEVPLGVTRMTATLDWTIQANNFDLVLEEPGGAAFTTTTGTSVHAKPESIEASDARPGTWHAVVRPYLAAPDTWALGITADVTTGAASIPTVLVPKASAVAGTSVSLAAEINGGTAPFTVTWEFDETSIAFDDATGETISYPYAGGTAAVKVKVADSAGLETAATALVREQSALNTPRPFTVVAVVDGSFNPYHYDFVGHQHPWNLDDDTANDFDFVADPKTYLAGYPGATPLDITIATARSRRVADLHAQDAAEWARFATSRRDDVRMYRFPGTKIIGAISFGGDPAPFYDTNSAHGTRSAASAVGNIHGTCPECLVVLIQGGSSDGLVWAAQQPWIDVVTNSYGSGSVVQGASGGRTRDNVYFEGPVAQTKAAAEAGQTIVFSAGNGLLNAFDAPPFTYWSSEKGPDWIVTVGAATPTTEQTFTGAGKPVDIASIGTSYPSTGGTTATGSGSHSGTSNAAPVTAGMFGKTIQVAREALGDLTPIHHGGIVAEGTAVACGDADPTCPLGDGILTRAELYDLVFKNVEPSPTAVAVQTIPTTPHAYYHQGHGVFSGRMNGTAHYNAEWSRIAAAAVGSVAPLTRPVGEANWFIVDSYCRQKLWGAWNGGYYRGVRPVLDPTTDPIATPFLAWCEAAPQDTFAPLQERR